MGNKLCEECKAELPKDRNNKLCKKCQKRNNKKIWKKVGIVSGVIASLALAVWLGYDKRRNVELTDLTNEKLDVFRENVRLDYCRGNERAWIILNIIDKEIAKRAGVNAIGKASNVLQRHREHGFNLYKPD